MATGPVLHRVHTALHVPLTYFDPWGVPIARSLWWQVCGVALAVFALFHTFIGAGLVLLVFGAAGVWMTATEPQLWKLLKAARKTRTRYDPVKRA